MIETGTIAIAIAKLISNFTFHFPHSEWSPKDSVAVRCSDNGNNEFTSYEHHCQGITESSKKQKLFLMSWCPDSAKIKNKMLYASSFETLKKFSVGVHKFIQATDISEASISEVQMKLRSSDRI